MPSRFCAPTLLLLAAALPVAAEDANAVVVTTEREPSPVVVDSSTAHRTSTPILDTPQSVVVVPQAILTQQRPLGLTDALENVSGVSGQPALNQNWDTSNQRLIRGFNAETARDGFTLLYDGGDRESLANVERIEVLKGPSGLFQGNGFGAPVGGLVNLITKKPQDQAFVGGGIAAGSLGLLQAQVDVNQPLTDGKGALARVTGEIARRKSHIDVIETIRGSVDPTVTLRNESGTSLTVHGRWSQRRQQDYTGLPQVGTVADVGYDLDREQFLGHEDTPRTTSLARSGDATFTQRWSEHLTLEVPFLVSRSSLKQQGKFLDTGFFVPPAPPMYGAVDILLTQEVTQTSASPTLTGTWDATTVQVGAVYDRVQEEAVMKAGGLQMVDITNPVWNPMADDLPILFNDWDNQYRTTGVISQATTTIAEQLTLSAGVRFMRITITDRDAVLPQGVETGEQRALPRFGIAWRFVPWASVFAGYAEGMRAQPGMAGYRISDRKAEKSSQYEIGFKVQRENLASATLAFYDLRRTDVLVSEPVFGGESSMSGEKRSRGLDVDVVTTPWTGWTVAGNYSLINAKVVKDPLNPTNEDRAMAAVPRQSGRVWAQYAFQDVCPGASLGAGMTAVGRQQVDDSETRELAGYATVDATASYAWQEFTTFVSVKNLTDAEYWVPYRWISYNVAPSEPITVVGGIDARF